MYSLKILFDIRTICEPQFYAKPRKQLTVIVGLTDYCFKTSKQANVEDLKTLLEHKIKAVKYFIFKIYKELEI